MAMKQFRLPDVGEGLTEADILGWAVAVGDEVKVNQVLIEIETAKAAVELPSPFAGTVRELLVEVGQTVDVGTPIITIETADAEGGSGGSGGSGRTQDSGSSYYPPKPESAAHGQPKREPVLVGYGVSQSATTRRARKAHGAATHTATGAAVGAGRPAAVPPPAAAVAAPPVAAPAPVAAPPASAVPARVLPQPGTGQSAVTVEPTKVLAKPLVRKLAKDLGVNLALITPTRPDGVITRDLVEQAAAGVSAAPAPAVGGVVATAVPAAALADQRIPIKGVRKATAAAMVSSAFTAPHVTEFLTVDVTRTMKLVQRLRTLPEYADVKVSPLLLVAKALLVAIAKHPGVNASWDEAAQEIVQHGSVNLGIAAATPRGLIVPNIKAAQQYSLRGLAGALGELTATAREGRTALADLTGGTITITNVGVFGVDTGTPILNPGEAAILAFGAVRRQPWVVLDKKGREKIKVRSVTTLGLSFDHRMIDGELGSKFLRDVGRVLEEPVASLV
ncbi:MAG TPA: dihydrolipoamide acetyltransferase family protein [Actinocrinis sp.]|nr:dihydrolipoamide acetyltransferase family protein [Actinocrinis sp.]